jgi:pSer/pThr/pTyr-binding forkhead associated (FHA) protein
MPDQFKNLLIITGVVIVLFSLWLTTIGITYWDAASRRKLSRIETTAWIVLVALVPGIGFAVYFLARLVRRATMIRLQPEPGQRTGTIPAAEFLQSASPNILPTQLSRNALVRNVRIYKLTLIAGPQIGMEYILDNLPVKIGRGIEVSIPLDDDLGVSRQHAEIYEQAGTLRIRDLMSTHGTKVNEFSITDKSLDPGQPVNSSGRSSGGAEMKPVPSEGTWRVRLISSRLPWGRKPDRPADVGDELCAAMLARENVLEDANYQKTSPNFFVVEIDQENYARNFQLLEDQILRQWNEKLLAYLLTANSRQGRQEYRFAGPLKIEIHPVTDLENDQARIRCRVQAGGKPDPQSDIQRDLPACLQIMPGGRRWTLHSGIVTIGRDPGCDVYLDAPEIQQVKLVSSQHAYLDCQVEKTRLFDGAPDGKPSLNGTYVNQHRIPPGGVELNNGDLILLAALDANRPNAETPGVASLRFNLDCR